MFFDMLIRRCPLLEELYLDILESTTNLSHELALLETFRYKTLVSLRMGWQISLYLRNSACLPNLKVLNLTDFILVSKDSFQRIILIWLRLQVMSFTFLVLHLKSFCCIVIWEMNTLLLWSWQVSSGYPTKLTVNMRFS